MDHAFVAFVLAHQLFLLRLILGTYTSHTTSVLSAEVERRRSERDQVREVTALECDLRAEMLS